MSYLEYDQSAQESQPEELYDFEFLADNSHYRVTSAAYPITFGGNTYTPIPIQRSEISKSSEISKNSLTITISAQNSFFNRMILGTSTYSTNVTIYILQPDGSYIPIWDSKIKGVGTNGREITVTCNLLPIDSRRPILSRKYQKQCPHDLFGNYCTVNRDDFEYMGTVTSFTGNIINAAIFATESDGWFTGGTIHIGNEIKTIVAHVGTQIKILDPFYEITNGDSLVAYAGCDHTIATCRSKFSNELNYGGCPWIPSDDNIVTGKPFIY